MRIVLRGDVFGLLSLLLVASCWPHSILGNELDTNATEGEEIEEVECSDDQKVFVAATEFILEGRNELLDGVERTALQAAFVEIYNLLTRDSCDSYFRKIQDMEFIAMTNFLNETISFEDIDLLSMLDGRPEGPLEGPPPEGPPAGGPNQPSFLENVTNATFLFDDNGNFIPPPTPGEGPPEGFPEGLPEGFPEDLPDVETLGNLTPCELLNEALPEEGPDGLPELPENGLPCEIIEEVLPPLPPPPTLPENPPPLPGGGPPRPPGPFGRTLRRRLEETVDDIATTNSTEGVAITYEVTGSCRDCPVSTTGSFSLFDDSFRLRMRFRVLEVRSATEEERSLQGPPLPLPPPPPPPPPTGDSPPEDSSGPPDGGPPDGGPPEEGLPGSENKDDCTCSAGLVPDIPQAPTIEALLEFLNERLVEIQEEQGILEGLVFQDLMQLDASDYQSLASTEYTDAAILSAEESTKSSNFGLMEATTKENPKGKTVSSSSLSKSMETKLDHTTHMTTSAGVARSIQVVPAMLLLVLAVLR